MTNKIVKFRLSEMAFPRYEFNFESAMLVLPAFQTFKIQYSI